MPYLLDGKQLSSFFLAAVSRRRSGNIKHVLSLFLGLGGFPRDWRKGGGGLSQEWKDIFDAARTYICAAVSIQNVVKPSLIFSLFTVFFGESHCLHALQSPGHPWENWQSYSMFICFRVASARA